MLACYHSKIDIARMLAGEFNANIDMQTMVRAIVRSYLCGYVASFVYVVETLFL